jgi:Tfp pilus assembly protein PilF
VVAWVSGTTESLFAILFLLSFLAYLQSRQASKALWMTLACLLYALALLSKETAIVLPALVFVHAWIEYTPSENASRSGYAGQLRAEFAPILAFLPIALVYLLVRNKVLSGLGHSIAPISPMKWLLTLPSILLFYVKNWFLPFRLSGFYDLFYQPKLSFTHVLLPEMILIALAAAVWILRVRLSEKAVAHAVAWMLIPLLPALDTFVFTPDNLVHDRYFYVPSIGAALLVALIIERAAKTRPGLFGQPSQVVLAGIGLTIVLAFFAGRAASSWSSDYAMFSRAHEIAPRNPTAMSNLAAEMLTRQDLAGAQKLLQEGYRNDPSDSRFTINLARLYYHTGDLAKAESFMMQSIETDPNQAEAYVYLGQIRLKQGRFKEAQENLRHAVALNPYSAAFHTSYGIVLALNGDCTNADQQFEASLALNPGDALTTIQMYRCRASLAPAAPPSTKPGQL